MRYDGGAVVISARESTSYAGMRPVPLRDHLAAVGARAGEMAQAVGLPSALVDAVRRAGHAHDLGKREPRWQAMVGGSEVFPLAKGPGGGDVTWLALPRGWRHEVASALSQSEPLVRHLVGSHHGSGRPLFPAAPHGDEWEALIGWGAQFARLNEEHGAWGLAYLEALVRLADWQVSEEEQSDVEHADADRTAA